MFDQHSPTGRHAWPPHSSQQDLPADGWGLGLMMGEVLTTVRATAAEVTAIKARLEVGTGRFEAMDERISAVEETQTDSRAAQTDTTAALAATRAHRLELLKAGSKYLIAAGLALATLMGKVTPEQLRAGLMKLAGI